MPLWSADINIAIAYLTGAAEKVASLWVGIDIIRFKSSYLPFPAGQGMIIRKLIDLPTTNHVGTAVTHIENVSIVAYNHKSGYSGTHVGFVALIDLADSGVRIFNRTL